MQNKAAQRDNPLQSTRWRVVFILTLTFLLNAGILASYFKFFLSQRSFQMVAQRYDAVRQQMYEQLERITDQAQAADNWQAFLVQAAKEEKMIIEVFDAQGEQVLVAPGGNTAFTISITDLMVIDDRPYLVRAEYPFSIDVVAGMQPSTTLLFAELLILFACTLFSGRVLYKQYILPLEEMRNIVEGYRRGIKPPVSLRKDELGNLQNSFVELTDSIENEKLKQKQIIASISHDIKTPLTSIMGYAERLQHGNISPERTQRYLATIYDKSRVIQQLIEEFDEYLSFDRQSELKLELFDATELVELLRRDFESELSELDVKLEIECTCQGRVLMDIAKMRRVFGNIIGNSLKHFDTPDKRISVVVTRSYGYVRFTIEDNGTGVPPQRLEHIFDPFYTSDEGRRVAGLGLSICQEIVQAHGGHIWAENAQKGLRICIEMKVVA